MNIFNIYWDAGNPLRRADVTLRRKAATASLAVATILIAVKAGAVLMTGSMSMLSSLVDSCLDFLASAVTLVSVFFAGAPADKDHRYGHGKLEALSAMCQSLFIFCSGLFLFWQSALRIISPAPVRSADLGFVALAISIGLTALLVRYQKQVVAETKSVAIHADSLHYTGDMAMNLAVLTALFLTYYTGWVLIDAVFAAGVAAFLMHSAWKVGHEAAGILMDKELPDEERGKILSLVRAHPAVRSLHDLRTRRTGDRIFIEFHMEVDGDLTLSAAHAITEDIERVLYKAYPQSEIIIHQEPAGIKDHRLDEHLSV